MLEECRKGAAQPAESMASDQLYSEVNGLEEPIFTTHHPGYRMHILEYAAVYAGSSLMEV